LQEAGQFEDIFGQMVKLREKIAANAGFKNYLDYAFRARGRFDYTPADCREFHSAVETEIMPVVCELQESRRHQLKLDSLRPWDLDVDPFNRAPLQPFADVGQMPGPSTRLR